MIEEIRHKNGFISSFSEQNHKQKGRNMKKKGNETFTYHDDAARRNGRRRRLER
jgi:hypothetical protein